MTSAEQALFKELMDKFLTDHINGDEKKQLFLLIRQPKYEPLVNEYMQAGFDASLNMQLSPDWEVAFDSKLKTRITAQHAKLKTLYYFTRMAAAAVLLFAFTGIAYLLFVRKTVTDNKTARYADVVPGHKGALLTLANGTKIMLDTARNGVLTTQNGLKVIKENGEIKYEGNTSEIAYNTASTNRGRQYQVLLSDGTKVWLNAESSIHYPLVFKGNERKVEITGEAYFEVAHNAAKPFIVKIENQEIKVLGTHFNVKSYNNEPFIITSLLKGSVEVVNQAEHILIKPGQQAATQHNIAGIEVSLANTEDAVAWKEGKFKFRNTDLKVMMRQLERWYDVQVKYDGNVSDSHFFGGTQMNENLSEVLRVLELSGIHFKMEGRTIIVSP